MKKDRRNVLIQIAEDCPVDKGIRPLAGQGNDSIVSIQFDVLSKNPYKYDELGFQEQVHHVRRGKEGLKIEKYDIRRSELCKSYGWGIHINDEGKLALYGCETEEYKKLESDDAVKKIRAYKKGKPTAKSGLVDHIYDSLRDHSVKEEPVDSDENERTYWKYIYSLLFELQNEDFRNAFNTWEEWNGSIKYFDKDNRREISKFLKDLKDGIGDKDENIRKTRTTITTSPLVSEFSLFSDLELKLREFIKSNLIDHYGGKDKGWHDGVKIEIRKQCASRQQEDPGDEIWAYLNFSEYPEIIAFKNNWNGVFKKHFMIEKDDAQKSADELTAFLREMVRLRNRVYHGRLLSKEESEKVHAYCNRFLKIYKKWKDDSA